MAKTKTKKEVTTRLQNVLQASQQAWQQKGDPTLPSPQTLWAQAPPDTSRHLRMKKFRFQLLAQWLIHTFPPCRVADIGGGKGLLAYLLQTEGWSSTVIDPVYQDLLTKYKSIQTGQRIVIPADHRVPHINSTYQRGMGQRFDLLIGLHAHGSNIKIIDDATQYGAGFLLMPCCIIDEPLYPIIGISWLDCLADYAIRQGHLIYPLQINFKGQNVGIFSPGSLSLQHHP